MDARIVQAIQCFFMFTNMLVNYVYILSNNGVVVWLPKLLAPAKSYITPTDLSFFFTMSRSEYLPTISKLESYCRL